MDSALYYSYEVLNFEVAPTVLENLCANRQTIEIFHINGHIIIKIIIDVESCYTCYIGLSISRKACSQFLPKILLLT